MLQQRKVINITEAPRVTSIVPERDEDIFALVSFTDVVKMLLTVILLCVAIVGWLSLLDK